MLKMNKTKKGRDGVKSQKGYWNAIIGIFMITALFGSGLYLAYDEAGITGMAPSTTSKPSGDHDPKAKYTYPGSPEGGATLTKEFYDEFVRLGKTPQIAGQQKKEEVTEEAEEPQEGDYYGLIGGEYEPSPNKEFMDKFAKNVGKVKPGKTYVKSGVLVTKTSKEGPTTLNYGSETVTLPAKAGLADDKINPASFNTLKIMDDEKWGGLSGLKVNADGTFTHGDLKGFSTPDGKSIVQDIVTGNSWSKMIVKNPDDGTTTTYECDSSQCTWDETQISAGEFTAEKIGKDGYVDEIWDKSSVDNPTKFQSIVVDGQTHNAMNVDGEFYYSSMTIIGLEWYQADCKPDGTDCGESSAGDYSEGLTEQQKAAADREQYGGGYTGWWNKASAWMGTINYAMSGYKSMSLLYDEPNPIIKLDETMSGLLGGIDGWTSLICQGKMTNSLDNGMAFSSSPDGAFAHVEGEKIIMVQYNESPPIETQAYKISVSVSPGGEDTGCDVKFSVYLTGDDGTLYIYENDDGYVNYSSSQKTFEVKRGENGISYAGSNMLFFENENVFQKVCIKFHDLYPELVSVGEGCLAGVNEGDELCNNFNELGRLDEFDDPCSNSFGFIPPNCWG